MRARAVADGLIPDMSEPFTPAHFLELLEKERRWYDLLDTMREIRSERSWPEQSREGQAVILMLQDRARQLRN